MNKGRFNCEADDCPNYVAYRISQKGNKVQEGSNCSAIYECIECGTLFCENHVKIHMNGCKQSVGYRNVIN